MPLTFLHCGITRVSDLSPLQGMQLTAIAIDERLFHTADETLLRSLPLTRINAEYPHYQDQSASDFWNRIATRRQAAEAFATETAKLPADQQAAAVTTKLKELNDDQDVPLGRIIENDAVTAATLILTDNTRDITPLRAFMNLKNSRSAAAHTGWTFPPSTHCRWRS